MSGEPARFLVELLLMIKKIKLHVNWFLLSRNKMEFDAVISNETMVPPCEPYYPNAKKVTDVAEVVEEVSVQVIINKKNNRKQYKKKKNDQTKHNNLMFSKIVEILNIVKELNKTKHVQNFGDTVLQRKFKMSKKKVDEMKAGGAKK